MHKKVRSKNPLNPKATFKWILWELFKQHPQNVWQVKIPSLINKNIDAYSKIPKLYGMEIITTEEVTDKLDMFQARFGKIDEFGW